jgi:hypothetical protein
VINSRESGFSRILKSEGGYWVPETLVEKSKTRNRHGSGTQIELQYIGNVFIAIYTNVIKLKVLSYPLGQVAEITDHTRPIRSLQAYFYL